MGIYLVAFLFCLSNLFGKEISYLDGSKRNNFAYDPGASYRDLNVWQKIGYMLAKYGVTIHSEKSFDSGGRGVLFFVDYRGHYPKVSDMQMLPKKRLMNILFEPPAVFETSYDPKCYALFSKIFTFHDGLVDGKKFIKFRYFSLKSMVKDLVPFAERKLCCTVIGNKTSNYRGELYSERVRAIRFFEKYHPEDFDFYGTGWNKKHYNLYKGSPENKIDVMKRYKFAFAYENTGDVPGYITEKIFDCFQAGVVPIYLGSPTVEEEIPKECFIDRRDFSSYEELYAYLTGMGEVEFKTYLENIRQFLLSDKGRLFDVDHFVLSIVNGILETDLTIDDLY
ncbi:MAG: hypothetical protein FJZ59_03515 [Chlamydiae bacterium]|nr:hypothetical protein [Chlamydiota bacterium]